MTAIAAIDGLLISSIALFQVLLATGRPLGEYAWGGQFTGVLPVRLRISSAFSAVILAVAAIVVWIEGGVLLDDLESTATGIAVWALVGFLVISVGLNAASKSRKERQVWTPVSGLALVLTLLVALLG